MQKIRQLERGELQIEFEAVKSTIDRFCSRLTDQIIEILRKEGILPAVPVESRVKSIESVHSKIERKKLRVGSVKELPDLVGIRIILLFARDVKRVCALLRQSFDVLHEEDAINRLGDSQFGYQSMHLQLRLPMAWLNVPTFKEFEGLTAEVQVRTASQHIWAAASHILQYKRESDVPLQVRRSINRVAALLETVDLELERTLGDRAEYKDAVDLASDNQELNVDLLRLSLESLISQERGEDGEPYDELLNELQGREIRTLGDLKKLLGDNLEKAEARDRDAVKRFKTEGKRDGDNLVIRKNRTTMEATASRIARGVWKTRVGLVREILDFLLQHE